MRIGPDPLFLSASPKKRNGLYGNGEESDIWNSTEKREFTGN
jgi:hypothetical protein